MFLMHATFTHLTAHVPFKRQSLAVHLHVESLHAHARLPSTSNSTILSSSAESAQVELSRTAYRGGELSQRQGNVTKQLLFSTGVCVPAFTEIYMYLP